MVGLLGSGTGAEGRLSMGALSAPGSAGSPRYL